MEPASFGFYADIPDEDEVASAALSISNVPTGQFTEPDLSSGPPNKGNISHSSIPTHHPKNYPSPHFLYHAVPKCTHLCRRCLISLDNMRRYLMLRDPSSLNIVLKLILCDYDFLFHCSAEDVLKPWDPKHQPISLLVVSKWDT